ncbi:hypothetical protein [Roseomonas sp. KE2513]|uniref:hypothetical protein n=1 Tax=Roseomonas sp. KE2513 TaxID=2479202 RepID=UPI0018E05E5A|nr:hypothetical protein [Roseomonas sp. KE2513]
MAPLLGTGFAALHADGAGGAGAVLAAAVAAARRAPVLARSSRMALSILGDAVWAAGMPGIGPGVATGTVEIPDAILPRFGRGFTARMPALMGYSGGPVVGSDGRLRGLVAAVPDEGGSSALALLAGMDLGGLAAGRGRRAFALSIHEVMEEVERMGLV